MLLRRLRRLICRWLLWLVNWICPAEINPRLEVVLLRDQLARLLSRNSELERQLADVGRPRLGLETMASTLVHSLGIAQQAMAEEAVDRRYAIPEVQTTLRGFVAVGENGLILRTVGPELTVSPECLGTINMTISQVPSASPTDGEPELVNSLEAVQNAFNVPGSDSLAVSAQEVVTNASLLLDMRNRYESPEFHRSMVLLAQSAVRLGELLRRDHPSKFKDFISSAQELDSVARQFAKELRPKATELTELATTMTHMTQAYLTESEEIRVLVKDRYS